MGRQYLSLRVTECPSPAGVQRDDEPLGPWVLGVRRVECACFALPRGRVGRVGADLNQLLPPVGVARSSGRLPEPCGSGNPPTARYSHRLKGAITVGMAQLTV